MRLPDRQVEPELPESSEISVNKKSRGLANGDPQDTAAEPNGCQSVKVVQQACWKKRVQLAKQDYLPSFPFHCGPERSKRSITRQLWTQPAPSDPAADEKSNSCRANIADEDNEKTPPQPIEKYAAKAQDASRQKQKVARDLKKQISDRTWGAELHYRLLHIGDPTRHREKTAARK